MSSFIGHVKTIRNFGMHRRGCIENSSFVIMVMAYRKIQCHSLKQHFSGFCHRKPLFSS